VPTAIYLHIPFCRIKCPYCDFNSYAGQEGLLPRYLDALCAELIARLRVTRPQPFGPSTVYLGGGTPSLMSPEQVARLLDLIRLHASPPAPLEVTLEANPGTVTRETLTGFRQAGVNRLTVGCQTFRPHLIGRLGRLHDVPQSRRALADARAAGFAELNLDLMFGLPGQTRQDWDADLNDALAEAPTHLSLYDLTVEPDTPFAQLQRQGRLPLPDEEARAAMYELACRRCEAAGMPSYEVSNFARPGSECLHNRIYWRGEPWIGAGAGAHGFAPGDSPGDHGRRWWNLRAPLEYIERVEAGQLPEEGAEQLTARQAMDEALLLGLRTREGLDLQRFEGRFGLDLIAALGPTLASAVDAGLITRTDSTLSATQPGRITLDSLIERLSRQLDRAAGSVTVP
jgi:oxygen-independent coproporphyrinogen III oxidase